MWAFNLTIAASLTRGATVLARHCGFQIQTKGYNKVRNLALKELFTRGIRLDLGGELILAILDDFRAQTTRKLQ